MMELNYNKVKENGWIIFEAIIGSVAYGTNTKESDVDKKYIYILPNDYLLGYKKYVPQINDEKNDCVGYELGRFLELLQHSNPNSLELLYSPEDCILEQSTVWTMIKSYADNFITQECKNSFVGYAQAQIKKASGTDKKMNWEKDQMVRKEPLDFCWVIIDKAIKFYTKSVSSQGTIPMKDYLKVMGLDQKYLIANKLNHGKESYQLFMSDKMTKGLQSDNGNTIRVESSPRELALANFIYNEDAYSKHCKKYKEYQDWLENRNTQRFVDVENHNQKIDGKNMLHCVRLLRMGQEILDGKGVIVRRPDAQELISIRKGEKDLKSIQDMCNTVIEEIKNHDISNLPENVADEFIHKLLTSARNFKY